MAALTGEGALQLPGLFVSARCEYGMRALLELATAHMQDPNRLVKADMIASVQGIPASSWRESSPASPSTWCTANAARMAASGSRAHRARSPSPRP